MEDQLNDGEKYALGHVCNWLQEVSEAGDIDDADLDESALSYLKSYKDSYSRKKPLPVCLTASYGKYFLWATVDLPKGANATAGGQRRGNQQHS